MPHLSDHSLRQIDDAYVQSLEPAALCRLSLHLLADLKEARDRLNQNPTNSSRPPSSRAPWERPAAKSESEAIEEEEVPPRLEEDAKGKQGEEATEETEVQAPVPPADELPPAPAAPAERRRRPGRQPGAPGVGRTQVLTAHETPVHRPTVCAGCGRPLSADDEAVAYTGFQSVDLRLGEASVLGLQVWVVDHRYCEVTCPCGHHTRAVAAQGEVAPDGGNTALSEWRWVGPGLVSLIAALSLRFRMSRARIQEFLGIWLGVYLSIGTLHQTLHEAAAAVAPAEEALIQAVQTRGLLHADETPWPQQDQETVLWLWVFVGMAVTYYTIAGRGKKTVRRVLESFQGGLMSDGWFSYRDYPKRLRCWAHLLRKAQGLKESCHADARRFGRQVHDTFHILMAAVYAAREGPPRGDLAGEHAALLQALRAACVLRLGQAHKKTRELAVELCNDWDAIFQVLQHPELPLTNNEAERALRHWVIARRISHGTRTSVGSRVFALLASVIDTCRQRGHSPWHYLAAAIADRRAGRPLAPLPQPGG